MVPGFDGGALAGADLDGGSVLAIGSTLAPTAEAGWSARDRHRPISFASSSEKSTRKGRI